MSDERDQTPADETSAEPVQSPETSAETPADTPSPAPRPRSATSRARRIGGAAVAAPSPTPAKPEADTDTAPADDTADDAADDTAATKTSLRKRRKTAGAEPAAAAATDEEGDGARPGKQVTVSLPGWLRWAPGFVFIAVAVAFLALFVVDRVGGDEADSTSTSLRQEVLAAAKTCLATVNTYRYDKIAAARAAGSACTTGKLTTDYQATVANVIGKNAPGLKATQLAKINAAGIESVTKNGKQWTVLAYGQLNITTANTGKQGRVDPFAVVARLQQVKGKWVLSKIDTVSSFSS